MNKSELSIGNCPHCTKVIFKNGIFSSNSSFMMRCPNCDKLLEVEIKTKIEIIVKPAERYIKNNVKINELSAFLPLLWQSAYCHCIVCIICTTKCLCVFCCL